MKDKKTELFFWKTLTNFWGVITAIFFFLTFFKTIDLAHSIKTLTIIYLSTLSIFTGIKEVNRWTTKKFISKYNGEIFIFIWTILMIIFVSLNAYNPDRYSIVKEFTTTYIAILGIFAVSKGSKKLKK